MRGFHQNSIVSDHQGPKGARRCRSRRKWLRTGDEGYAGPKVASSTMGWVGVGYGSYDIHATGQLPVPTGEPRRSHTAMEHAWGRSAGDSAVGLLSVA